MLASHVMDERVNLFCTCGRFVLVRVKVEFLPIEGGVYSGGYSDWRAGCQNVFDVARYCPRITDLENELGLGLVIPLKPFPNLNVLGHRAKQHVKFGGFEFFKCDCCVRNSYNWIVNHVNAVSQIFVLRIQNGALWNGLPMNILWMIDCVV